MIRPEAIFVSKVDGGSDSSLSESATDSDNRLPARVQQIDFTGATTTVTLNVSGLVLEALVLGADGFAVDDQCLISLPADRIQLLSPI